MGKPVIDRANKAVRITLPNGVTRTAVYLGDQGCVTLALGKKSVNFTPVKIKSLLPDPSAQPWPMGDVLTKDPLPPELDASKLKQAVDAAFEPAAEMTAAFVVTWKGRLVAERYGEHITGFENPDHELLLFWIVTPAGFDGFFRDTSNPPGVPPKRLTHEQINEIARKYSTDFR